MIIPSIPSAPAQSERPVPLSIDFLVAKSEDASKDLPKSVGRPRTAEPSTAGSPRDQIITAATRLFAHKGYALTNMSDIARAAGMRQSSLYYWFRKKELILQATLTLNRASLDFIDQLESDEGSTSLKLYRVLRFDTKQLCLAPWDFNEIERLAQAQQSEFVDFWRDYETLFQYVHSLVEAGLDEKQFSIYGDTSTAATNLLCIGEGIQKRFRYHDGHEPSSRNPFTYPRQLADECAEDVATIALRSILSDTSELAEIQREASKYADPCDAYSDTD